MGNGFVRYRNAFASGAIAVVALLAAFNTVVVGADWQHHESLREFLKRGYQFFKLDLAVLSDVPGPAGVTIVMALAGTVVGAAFAAPIARVRGADRIAPRARAAAALLSLTGSLPALLWGLLAVWALGPGPVAGTVAIAIRSLRPIADRMRGVPGDGDAPGPLRAASRELTHNVARAAALGLVGCGGIGFTFYARLYTYQFGAAAVIALVVVALIVVTGLAASRDRTWPWRLTAGVDPAPASALAGTAGSGAIIAYRLALAVLAIVAVAFAALQAIGLPAAAAPAPTAIAGAPGPVAFALALAASVSQTLQMAALAAVVGVAAARLVSALLPDPVARAASLLALVAPTLFVALVCRSITGVGPAAGVVALCVAAFGLATLPPLAGGAQARTPHSDQDGLGQLVDAFDGVLPAAAIVGLFGAGGVGWSLKLAILSGQPARVAAAFVTIAALLVVARNGCAAVRQRRAFGVPDDNPLDVAAAGQRSA